MKYSLYNLMKLSDQINALWPLVKRDLLAGEEMSENRIKYNRLMDQKRKMREGLARKEQREEKRRAARF